MAHMVDIDHVIEGVVTGLADENLVRRFITLLGTLTNQEMQDRCVRRLEWALVRRFLLREGLSAHEPIFVANDLDSMEVLMTVTESDLSGISDMTVGLRKKLVIARRNHRNLAQAGNNNV